MSLELLVNVAWAVTIWLAVTAAAVFLLSRRPAAIRRSACRLGLLGLPVVLVGAILMHRVSPSAGLFRRPAETGARLQRAPEAAPQPAPAPLAARPPARAHVAKAAQHNRQVVPTIPLPKPGREGQPVSPAAKPARPQRAVAAWAQTPGRPARPALAVAGKPTASAGLPTPMSHRDWAVAAGILSVSGGLALALGVRLLRLRMWRRTWRPAPPAWVSLTHRLAKRIGIGRPVSVVVAPGLSQPAAAGVIRPAIVLPPRLPHLPGLSLRGALAHELGHLDGRDPLWNLLAQAAVALAWWCPLTWWLQRRARIEGELTADDHALGSGVRPIDLARTLARFAEHNQCPTPAAISGMACHLTRRIEMIMSAKHPHDARISRPSRWILGCAAFLAAVAIVAMPLVGIADEGEGRRPRREEGGERAAVRKAEGGERPTVRREEGGERPTVRRERGGEGRGAPKTEEAGERGRTRKGEGEGRGRFVAAQRIVCQTDVADGWLGLQAHSKVSRKLFWAIRLCPAHKDAKAAVRCDGRFVVVTYGNRRFVIDGETGQLRTARPDRAAREEGREGERRVEARVEGDRDREGEGRGRRERTRDEEGEGRVRRERARDEEGEGRARRERARDEEGEGRVRRERARDEEGEGRARRERARDEEGEGRPRREGDRVREGEGVDRPRRERARQEPGEREGMRRVDHPRVEARPREADIREVRERIERLRRQLEEARRLLQRLEREQSSRPPRPRPEGEGERKADRGEAREGEREGRGQPDVERKEKGED